MRKIVLFFLFMFMALPAFSERLNLVEGRVYVLNFDDEIQNIHVGNSEIDAQILHTIFDDRKQIILTLNGNQGGFLQVKTEDKLFNYDIKAAAKSSGNLVEIDIPPLENIEVDVYTGE